MVKDLMNTIKSDASDKNLIEAIKNKSEKAFSIVYTRYADVLKKHLKFKTSNNRYLDNVIEDAVSETFVTLWQNIVNNKYEDQGYLKAYLQKIAYFKLLKKTKQDIPIKDYEAEIKDENNEEDIFKIFEEDTIDYLRIAEKALQTLNEICLKLIMLKQYDKLSDIEIYDVMKSEISSVRNVRSRRSHCMEQLRLECKKELSSIESNNLN